MIVITGSAGFIASCLLTEVLATATEPVVIVDDFGIEAKKPNFTGKKYSQLIHRDQLDQWFQHNGADVTQVYHLGARTDTTEMSVELFNALNLDYSKMVWVHCVKHNIPLVYASSAATYGEGEHGFDDNHEVVAKLKPLNPYGESKNDFDKWVLKQDETPPKWIALKFFNVYGPNEYHKSRMASVIFHTFHQIKKTGGMKLFKSHRDDYKDGEQSRDFVYVKDVVNMTKFLMENDVESGIYNIGTGKARSFYDLASATFAAMGLEPNISFIDTPADIRDKYQYFTEANISKLRAQGYDQTTYSLEDGVKDYVQMYLMNGRVL